MMLITEQYRAQNAAMHAEKPHYGTGARLSSEATKLARLNHFCSILDYGCGKGAFRQSLALDLAEVTTEYDPAIEGKETASPAELVVCSDVLEHVEPECLDAVLQDLRRLTLKLGLFLIATVPAFKHLPDGRNAHLIVENVDWWHARLIANGFHPLKESQMDGGFVVVVA